MSTRPLRAFMTTCAVRLITAVLMVALPSALVGQTRPSSLPLPDKLASTTRLAIEKLCDSLDAEHLPAYAVRDRAAEGVLKGADDARILTVVRALATRLRQSRSLLGAAARDDELLASASALFIGVEPASISRLALAQRKRGDLSSLAISLTVVAELTNQRVPVDVAVTSVETLLGRGANDTDLSAFRNAIERDIRQGSAPRDAVTTGLRATMNGLRRTP